MALVDTDVAAGPAALTLSIPSQSVNTLVAELSLTVAISDW